MTSEARSGGWPGLFVTFEGVDGAGKSTQLRLAAAGLRAAGRDVIETREPGGAPGAEEIRQLLVTGAPGRWSATSELLLFNAARRDHWERTLAPALATGSVVLCDRFVDSTRAYQSAARGEGAQEGGVSREMVEALHQLAIGKNPDLTLIYDLDPTEAQRRGGAGAEDRFERFGAAFQGALREAFRAIAAADPGRCRLIDAGRDPEAVAADTLAAVEATLAARGGAR